MLALFWSKEPIFQCCNVVLVRNANKKQWLPSRLVKSERVRNVWGFPQTFADSQVCLSAQPEQLGTSAFLLLIKHRLLFNAKVLTKLWNGNYSSTEKGFETQYLRKQASNISAFSAKGQRAPNFLFQLADVAPFGLNMGLAWILAMGSFGWVGTTSTFQMVLSKMHHQEHYSKLSVFAMNWREC